MTWLLVGWAGLWLMWAVARIRWGDRGWVSDLRAWGLLALAVLAFHWRVVWGDVYVPADGGDMGSFLYPMFHFNARSIREGIWPLWNPYAYGGFPYVGEVQSGLYYPPNWPFFLWGRITYKTLEGLTILHMWWAAVGAYTLARSFSPGGRPLRREAAFLAGIAFGLSDVFLVHFGNENLNAAAAWLPWTLWAARQALHREDRSMYALTALFLGLAFLAGHPQMALYVGLALLFFLLLTWLTREERTWRWWAPWVPVALLAGGIAAVVLLPGWELTRLSERSGWSYGEAVGYSFAPGQFIGLLIPGFFGRGAQLYWGVWPRVEVGYVGVVTLFLAALGVLRYWGREVFVWGGLGLLAFFIALGAYAPVHGWLTAVFPPMHLIRAPARFLLVMDLALALLAAWGMEALLSRDARADARRVYRWIRGMLLVTAGLFWPMLMIGLLLGQGQDRVLVVRQAVAANAVGLFLLLLALTWGLWRFLLEGRITPRVAGVLLPLFLLVDLAAAGAYVDLGGSDPTARYHHPALVQFLRGDSSPFRVDSRTGIEAHWLPNTGMVWGVEDVNGVANPLLPAFIRRFLNTVGGWDSHLYPLLNTKYLIASKEPPFDPARFPPVFSDDPVLNVYLNPDALPRAFLVRDVTVVSSSEDAWRILAQPTFSPGTQAVVEASGAGAAALADLRPGGAGGDHLAFARRELNRVVLHVQVTQPALLILGDFWYPGWRVTVEGEDGTRQVRSLWRVDGALRGVLLRPGDRVVTFVFRPTTWYVGLVLSILSALVVLGIGVRYKPFSSGNGG